MPREAAEPRLSAECAMARARQKRRRDEFDEYEWWRKLHSGSNTLQMWTRSGGSIPGNVSSTEWESNLRSDRILAHLACPLTAAPSSCLCRSHDRASHVSRAYVRAQTGPQADSVRTKRGQNGARNALASLGGLPDTGRIPSRVEPGGGNKDETRGCRIPQMSRLPLSCRGFCQGGGLSDGGAT